MDLKTNFFNLKIDNLTFRNQYEYLINIFKLASDLINLNKKICVT